MLLRGISCQLDMTGTQTATEEVWFILNGDGFVLSVVSILVGSNAEAAGIKPSSVMNSPCFINFFACFV